MILGLISVYGCVEASRHYHEVELFLHLSVNVRVSGGLRQALTYMLDDPTDCGLKEFVHGLTRHPEHPL